MSARHEELERSFTEILYEWMERAPWLALSAAAHLILFLNLGAQENDLRVYRGIGIFYFFTDLTDFSNFQIID